jgi:hypothetical protein
MGQELGERHSQHQEEKRHRRYTLLARIGLFLLVLSLGSWGLSTVFIFSARNIPTIALARIIPSNFFHVQSVPPPPSLLCFSVTPQGPLTFTVMQGQSDRAVQTVTLAPQPQPGCHPAAETWSGKIVTYQGSHWLSISPTQGDLSNSQSVSIIVSSSSLAKGVYTGLITFTPKYGDLKDIVVAVDVARDRQGTSLGDIVAYTSLAELNTVAKWPHLIKGQSVNMTISLLSSRNLPRNLLHAATPTTTQYTPFDIPEGWGFVTGEDNLLERAFGSQLISLIAQLNGTAFDISPSTPPPQDPNQRVVSFHWNILPKEAGLQDFEVNIAGQWEDGGGLETTYFLYSEFSVNVDESPVPFITIGQVTLSALLLSLLGSLLNVPWILDYIQKRKEQKQKQHAASVSSKSTPSQPTGKRRRRGLRGSRRQN